MPTPIGHALGGAIVALALMPEAVGSALARLQVRGSAAAGSPAARAAVMPRSGGPSTFESNTGARPNGRAPAASPRLANPQPPEAANLQGGEATRTYLFFCTVAACLPDIDFFWGRHNMETHSLG